MTKFAIGCLVQWYEFNIIQEYVSSLEKASQYYEGEVIGDCWIHHTKLKSWKEARDRFNN